MHATGDASSVSVTITGYRDAGGTAVGSKAVTAGTNATISFGTADSGSFKDIDELRFTFARDVVNQAAWHIDTMVMAVAEPDVADSTAPTFDGTAPSASSITTTGFTANASLDESGTVYYVVVADGAAAPTAAQVAAGTASGGGAALASGSAATAGTTPFDFSSAITGLKSGTAYDLYVVGKDTAGNTMATATKVDVTTSAATVALSVNNATVAENAGTSTVTATLSAAASADTTVTIGRKSSSTATLTDDFTLSSTTITITAGNTTGTATLTAVQDALDEAGETAIIEITAVSGGGGATESGTQEATVTITDDDATPDPVDRQRQPDRRQQRHRQHDLHGHAERRVGPDR